MHIRIILIHFKIYFICIHDADSHEPGLVEDYYAHVAVSLRRKKLEKDNVYINIIVLGCISVSFQYILKIFLYA